MHNNKTSLQFFTKPGIRILTKLGIPLVLGLIILCLIPFISSSEIFCGKSPSDKKCTMPTDIAKNIGITLLSSVLTVAFVDMTVQRESLEEFQSLLDITKKNRDLQGFFLKKSDYESLIEQEFFDLRPNKVIKILLISSEEFSIFTNEKRKYIKELVKNGACIKILILHPLSSLNSCIGNYPLAYKPRYSTLYYFFKEIYNDLFNSCDASSIDGSLEVKLHRDTYSSVGYFSSKNGSKINCQLVWLHLDDADK